MKREGKIVRAAKGLQKCLCVIPRYDGMETVNYGWRARVIMDACYALDPLMLCGLAFVGL